MQKDVITINRFHEEKASVTISKQTQRDLTCKSDDASDIFYSRPSIVAVFSAKKITNGESFFSEILLAVVVCITSRIYIMSVCISANTTWRLSKIIFRYKLQLLRNVASSSIQEEFFRFRKN